MALSDPQSVTVATRLVPTVKVLLSFNICDNYRRKFIVLLTPPIIGRGLFTAIERFYCIFAFLINAITFTIGFLLLANVPIMSHFQLSS